MISLVSSLISLAANLLPEVSNTFFAPSSSTSAEAPDARAVKADLKRLMRMMERIKATLYDAEGRSTQDRSLQLWLKELRELMHDAEYLLDEYMYEVYRARVEAKKASELNHTNDDPEQSVVYPVQIPHGMVDRIRDIKSRFEEITKDREALCLQKEHAPRRHYNERQPIPTCPSVAGKTFGREVEKEKVIKLLFLNYHKGEVISVLPIVGKAGLGKTFLAQLVYNDKRVKDRFDMLAWVYVSDDFNIKRISRDIIESFTRNGCDLKNSSILLEELGNKVKGKKIFLVLDDVWNEKLGPWDSLCTILMLAKTATILVTTRNVSVARIMQTMNPFPLEYLSDETCWLLFKHYAFQGIKFTGQSSLVEIGKERVKKCGGLPLAVKTVASLLRNEVKAQSWMEILHSDLWELDAGNEIIAALQISYERLPMYLKPCLLLCSVFPKGYNYGMDQMSRLWIANGYIEPKERKNPEEVALDYTKELHECSFFGNFKTNNSVRKISNWNPVHIYQTGTFKLHDMVHDLAWLNFKKTCYTVERGIPKEIFHLYLNEELKGSPECQDSIDISVLKTLVMGYPWSYSSSAHPKSMIGKAIFSKINRLRALDLGCVEVHPLSLGHLKHLRYLSIGSESLTKISPQFVFSCYSLQMLILNISTPMKLEGIGNLINLESLTLLSSCDLTKSPESSCPIKLPESLGLLSKLRVLEIRGSCNRTILKEYVSFQLPECIGNLVELYKIVIMGIDLQNLPESFCNLQN